jgi:hypothetical protein
VWRAAISAAGHPARATLWLLAGDEYGFTVVVNRIYSRPLWLGFPSRSRRSGEGPLAMDTRDPLRGPLDTATLRRECDLTPYLAGSDEQPWLRAWSAMACDDAGALSLIGPGGTHVRREDEERLRLPVDRLLFLLCGILSRARSHEAKLAVGCPPGARHVPLILAVASVLARTLERAESARSSGPILVVSQDLDLRRCYCDILVGRGVHALPLNDVHPGSRLLSDGKRQALVGKILDSSMEGVCFFLPGLAPPRSLGFSPRQVVVDMRLAIWHRRLSDLVPWLRKAGKSVVALYTLGDFEAREKLTRADFLDLPLDHAAIRACRSRKPLSVLPATDHPVDGRLCNLDENLVRRHRLQGTPGSEPVEGALRSIREMLATCPDDLPDVQRARWVVALLARLPTPTGWYEAASHSLGRGTLKGLIERLGYRVDGQVALAPVMQTVRAQLLNLYDRLTVSNPLGEATARHLSAATAQHPSRRTLLLVRDRVVARAAAAWLESEGLGGSSSSAVEICSCNDFHRLDNTFGAVVVIGSFPSRYRWLSGAKLADDVTFVAYSFEWDAIERQLMYYYSTETAARNADAIGRCLTRLGCIVPRQPSASAPLPPLSLDRAAVLPGPRSAEKAAAIGKSLAGLASLLKQHISPAVARDAPEPDDVFEEDPPGASAAEPIEVERGDGIPCMILRVQSRWKGRGRIPLSATSIVDCITTERAATVERMEAQKLTQGTTLIRIDEEGRVGLFDRITELAQQRPGMENISKLRGVWQAALTKLAGRYRSGHAIDYGRILTDLRARGATIQTSIAIRFWFADIVIAPQTVATIRAVGLLAEQAELADQAATFDTAFRGLRSLHQQLGKQLADAIRRSVSADTGRSSGTLDAVTISMSELVESADLCEVLAIEHGPVAVAAHRVGRFIAEH